MFFNAHPRHAGRFGYHDADLQAIRRVEAAVHVADPPLWGHRHRYFTPSRSSHRLGRPLSPWSLLASPDDGREA